MKRNTALLEKACRAWADAEVFRANRERLKNHTFGIVDDTVPGAPGGQIAMNMIRRIVRILVGRFRAESAENMAYDGPISRIAHDNCLAELDARALEEFIISGCAIQRISAERRPDGEGVWVDNVDPRRFFVNSFSDPRGSDIEFIGMFHDFSWPRLANRFGSTSAARFAALRQLFERSCRDRCSSDLFMPAPAAPDIMCADTPGKIRLAEVWSLESRPHKNMRYAYDMVWRCRWLAPDGSELEVAASSAPHRSHPFVLKMYPLIDGEVHSFIEDLVERQNSVNRLLKTFESTVASSAKGALIFPAKQLVRGYTFEDVGKLWARPDSIIPISGQDDRLPVQLITNNTSSGIIPIVDMQLKLFEESSGVSDALLGRTVSGTVSTEMYRAIMAGANASIADVLDCFRAFIADRNAKALSARRA